MPLPFFCAVCEKPIAPSKNRKYATVHDKCMMDYLDSYSEEIKENFKKNITTTDLPRNLKK
tara:strand:+ start:169 stop:351 length:183 start_codon:yes stop_codon:yes gene_type:complete